MKYCFGIDIGGTTIKMGLFSECGNLLEKWELRTRNENQGENILPDIWESISSKLTELDIKREDILALGVGVPAAVRGHGVVDSTTNLGWGYKEVKRELEELTGFLVYVENDANVAALGEMWKGGGCGSSNLVMVTLGTGVGGGIIVDGHIVTGVKGGAGEIGDICVNYNETEQSSGAIPGSLEYYTSATGIVRMAKKKLDNGNRESVLNYETVTARDVFDAVKIGDVVAIEVAEEFGCYLGRTLANIAVTLDPDIFIIGGGVSKAGEILLEYIRKYCDTNVSFALAELGNDAGIYGAAMLVLDTNMIKL